MSSISPTTGSTEVSGGSARSRSQVDRAFATGKVDSLEVSSNGVSNAPGSTDRPAPTNLPWPLPTNCPARNGP